jgi:hypothetical protein
MMLFHSLLFAMGLMVGLGDEKEWYRTIVRQELQIVHKNLPDAKDHPLREISVFIELGAVQPRVAGGMCFVIDVGNDGPEPVELVDITTPGKGRIAIQLWNADGVRMDLPDREAARKGNPGGWARRHGLPERIKAEIEQRRPFAVMKPDFLPDDPKVKSIESIKDGKIRLEPGEHFQVQVLVTKVLAEPEKWRAEIEKRSANPHTPFPGLDPPEMARIAAGTYTLSTSVALFVEGRVLWSASSERLTVRLGPPADEAKEP